MPDVTSTDAGDATGAAPANHLPRPFPTAAHDPWTVTAVVVAAMLIAACVAAGLSAIVPSRTEIPGLPTAGSITALRCRPSRRSSICPRR